MPRPPLPEERTALVLTDPHSPEKFRVNGVLFNIPELQPGDALYREVEKRPVAW
jgi:putative endopeptidase